MWYNHPVQFYDTTSAPVASFSTRFNFAFRVTDRNAGDAMSFSIYSWLPPSSGGTNQSVAVRLDALNNAWGINTESTSVNTTRLPNFQPQINVSVSATASITFSNSTRVLVASLHFDDNPSLGSYEASANLTPVKAFLPSVVGVGFSATAAANVDKLYQITSWSFNSTLARKGDTDDTSYAVAAFLIIGITILLLAILVAGIWFCVASYKHRRQSDSFVKGARDLAERYQFRELDAATDKFSKSRELGQGAFGVVFEGKLEDEDGQQLQVAVKKLKWSNGEIENFHAEVKTISETRHKNLVRLNGWCSRNTSSVIDIMCWCGKKQHVELFLVYELVRNGNLDTHLKQKQHVLPWATRYNIVKDIGSALRYLHHECSKYILHRDIKPSNILLDEQFNAKLADFGLSRIAHHKNEAVRTTARDTLEDDYRSTAAVQTKAMGTRAYMDPNCIKDGIVNFTRYSDVYSFGIVLLEITCTGKSRAQVWEQYKHNPENMAAAADARLDGNFEVAQMQQVVVLGLWCSFLDDTQRPCMLQAMEVLEHDAALPNLIELET